MAYVIDTALSVSLSAEGLQHCQGRELIQAVTWVNADYPSGMVTGIKFEITEQISLLAVTC